MKYLDDIYRRRFPCRLLLTHFAQVTPGAKGFASAAYDHYAHVRVIFQAGHHGGQFLQGRTVQGITLLGTVEGDGGNMVMNGAENLVRHALSSPRIIGKVLTSERCLGNVAYHTPYGLKSE